MFDVTPIIELVITIIVAIISYYLIPYIKSKVSSETLNEIVAWVNIAVAAAEQIYTGSGRGEEKKAYVLNWLSEHNITYDANTIDALIEAAVYELNQSIVEVATKVLGSNDETDEVEEETEE